MSGVSRSVAEKPRSTKARLMCPGPPPTSRTVRASALRPRQRSTIRWIRSTGAAAMAAMKRSTWVAPLRSGRFSRGPPWRMTSSRRTQAPMEDSQWDSPPAE